MPDTSSDFQGAKLLERRQRIVGQINGWEGLTHLTGIEITNLEERSVTFTFKVGTENLNARGFGHGGFLFTLCDMVGGCLVYANGLDCVTQNSSINYLGGARAGDVLTCTGKALHWGHSTKVIDVCITNQDGKAIVHSTNTMFVIGELKS